MDYSLVGYIGLANNVVVSSITIWRTIRWYMQWDNPETWSNYTFKKKLLFHLLLMFTAFSDIPMYVGFILYQEYTTGTYSLHKLASTFLFAALSITIGDWASVLKDINEYPVQHFLFRRVTLISLNVVYIAISGINFILLLSLSNLDSYLNSPLYTCGIFLQIIMNFLLTTMMLHAGLKLYSRIHGAVGHIEQPAASEKTSSHRSIKNMFRVSDGTTGTPTTATTNPLTSQAMLQQSSSPSFSQSMNFTNSTSISQSHLSQPSQSLTPAAFAREPVHSKSSHSMSRASLVAVDGNMELKNALNNLNFVMATCTFCILLQMIMLTLNYALGYADKADKTVGPPFFYWTCSYYVPLWGPILALLYLSRSQSHRKRAKFLSMHRHSDEGLEGARTSFSPSKMPPPRTPQHLRQFSTDTDDLEALYMEEQQRMMLQSPLIDGATLLEYSAGGQSHNMLYANHLMAAQQQGRRGSGNVAGKRRRRRSQRPPDGSQQPPGSSTAMTDVSQPPRKPRMLKGRHNPRQSSMDTERGHSSDVDVLTQHRIPSSDATGSSYSLNPTHVSMSLGTSHGSGAGLFPGAGGGKALPSSANRIEEGADEEYADEGDDGYHYGDDDGEGSYEDGDDVDGDYYDEEGDGDGDGDGDGGEYVYSDEEREFDENRSDASTLDTNRFSQSMRDGSYNMQYRDTTMTTASLPSELIFPHNFNLRPPAHPFTSSSAHPAPPQAYNSSSNQNNNSNANATTARRKSSNNTASIAARLVSRAHSSSTHSRPSGASATTGDGSQPPGAAGRMNSYDYSYRGEEERFDGVFR